MNNEYKFSFIGILVVVSVLFIAYKLEFFEKGKVIPGDLPIDKVTIETPIRSVFRVDHFQFPGPSYRIVWGTDRKANWGFAIVSHLGIEKFEYFNNGISQEKVFQIAKDNRLIPKIVMVGFLKQELVEETEKIKASKGVIWLIHGTKDNQKWVMVIDFYTGKILLNRAALKP